MPRLEIDINKIKHNAKILKELFVKKGISITSVIKGVTGSPEIAKAILECGISIIAVALVQSIKNMKNLKPRRITNKIMTTLLKSNDLIVLLGARQVGKTSIMHLLIDSLLQVEKVKSNRVFYFDLEDMNLLEVVNRGVVI